MRNTEATRVSKTHDDQVLQAGLTGMIDDNIKRWSLGEDSLGRLSRAILRAKEQKRLDVLDELSRPIILIFTRSLSGDEEGRKGDDGFEYFDLRKTELSAVRKALKAAKSAGV